MPWCRSSSSPRRPRSSSGGSSFTSRARRRASRAGRRRAVRRWRCRKGASARAASFQPVSVRELELDLDAFEGPFDLLLSLVLREELSLAEIDVAGIVLSFVERLAEQERLDLEACGEFLVLVGALLELKARALFGDEEAEAGEVEAAEAAEGPAPRLGQDRRVKGGPGWAGRAAGRPRGPLFPARAA